MSVIPRSSRPEHIRENGRVIEALLLLQQPDSTHSGSDDLLCAVDSLECDESKRKIAWDPAAF